MNNLYTMITSCRVCGGEQLESILNLGELYISDFIKPGDAEHKAPLELVICNGCSLVQLRHTVSRDLLYRDTPYYYHSSANKSMVRALKDVVEDACSRVHLWPQDKVLDIGCNDGTLLSFYPTHIDTYGYEPAWNIWEVAKKKRVGCIYPTYFPHLATTSNEYKVITSIAQLYNVDDLNAYVRTIKKILRKDGIWIVQMQDLEGMIACNGLDNICHEHVTYFSKTSMDNMLAKHGLIITNESHNLTNGGSVRFVITHSDVIASPCKTLHSSLYRFKMHIEDNKVNTVNLLHSLKLQGRSVIGLAAST